MCKICDKIFKKPVVIPCGCEHVCKEHLKGNIHVLTCQTCHSSFDILSEKFLENSQLETLVNSNRHLCDDERQAKIEIEKKFELLEDLLNEINEKGSEFNLIRSEHFYNLRNEIDIRRESLIEEAYAHSSIDQNDIDKI